MRLKYLLLSILLIGGMDLFAQDANGLFPMYDFSLRNAVYECFTDLQSGGGRIDELLLSEQAVAEGSDFPEVVRSLLKKTRAEFLSSVTPLSPIKPYVGYEYRYVSRDDVSYVIGVAVAEFRHPEVSDRYPMTSRPLYFVYTDKGWKAFWVGDSWKSARFENRDKLVVLEKDGTEVAIADLVGKLRDGFLADLVSMAKKAEPVAPSKPVAETKPKTEPKPEQKQDSAAGDQPEPEESSDVITYEKATVKPTFGGRPASSFSDWVKRHVKYPDAARKQGLSGTTKIKFTIDQEGRVMNVKVAESAGKRTKQQFEEEMEMASFIVSQFESQMDELMKKNAPIQNIMDLQKKAEQAKQRVARLKKLHSSKTYVLPEYDVLDREAMRVVASSPDWEPGEYNEVAVPVQYTVSVTLKP